MTSNEQVTAVRTTQLGSKHGDDCSLLRLSSNLIKGLNWNLSLILCAEYLQLHTWSKPCL